MIKNGENIWYSCRLQGFPEKYLLWIISFFYYVICSRDISFIIDQFYFWIFNFYDDSWYITDLYLFIDNISLVGNFANLIASHRMWKLVNLNCANTRLQFYIYSLFVPKLTSSREKIDICFVAMILMLFKLILNFDAFECLIEWRYWMKLYNAFVFNPFCQWLAAFTPEGSSISRAMINRSFCISQLLGIRVLPRAIGVSVLARDRRRERKRMKKVSD